MAMPKVSIVLVNWNNFEDSEECLKSLKKVTYPNYEVLLVDNASEGNDVELFKLRFGDSIRLIENDKNYGFAKGCNIGMTDALSRGADYVVLLNNDTVVPPDFLDTLVSTAQSDHKIGIAGGKVYCYEYPEMIWFAGGIIDYQTGKTPIRGSGETDHGQYDEITEVDWICGCFMFITRDLLQSIGMFDERFFFGWEDADLCVRTSKSDYRIFYVPTSKVWHKGWFGDAKRKRLKGRPLYYATRGSFIFREKHFTKQQRQTAWLHFIVHFPKFVWDYSRILDHWKSPIYIVWAIFDFLKMKIRGEFTAKA